MSESESTAGVHFKISTYSDGGGCVEVGRTDHGMFAVRHSKEIPHGSVIYFTEREWTAFVAGVKAGEFDTF